MVAVSLLSCASDSARDPDLLAVIPNRVLAGIETRAQVVGRHFNARLRVDLASRDAPRVERTFDVWIGATALEPSTVRYVSDSALDIVIPNTLAVGTYELRVKTPTGRWATLDNALAVVASSELGAAAGLAAGAAGTSTGVSSSGAGATSGGSHSGGTDTAGSPNSAGRGGTVDATRGGSAGSAVLFGGGGSSAGNAGTSGVAGSRVYPTMRTQGRFLLDACGNVVVMRGVQQILSNQLPPGNNWAQLMDEIAKTGANAVRIQLDTAALTVSDLETVITRLESHRMVTIVNPDGDSAWWGNANVQAMLARHKSRLILEAYCPAYDDRTKFVTQANAAVARLRGYGYQVPLIVLSNAFGRDLPAALNHGAQIVLADPLHNTILGWDAYWGDSNWYQNLYGMSLAQGVAASAAAAFPIQIGLTLITDSSPTQYLDYSTAMTAAQANSIGWLWWDWYNPYGAQCNLSANGTSSSLLALGNTVVNTHPGGLAHASIPACQIP